MSFYGYRSTEMLREIAKWADGRATLNTPTLQPHSSHKAIQHRNTPAVEEILCQCTSEILEFKEGWVSVVCKLFYVFIHLLREYYVILSSSHKLRCNIFLPLHFKVLHVAIHFAYWLRSCTFQFTKYSIFIQWKHSGIFQSNEWFPNVTKVFSQFGACHCMNNAIYGQRFLLRI